MSFWSTKLGQVDGSPSKAFTNMIKIIPDGTQAIARLCEYKMHEFESGQKIYNATWQLLEGDYKGIRVRQKLSAFDEDENKAYRARNMMKLLNNLGEVEYGHENEPAQADLNKNIGLIAGIIIQQWQMDGKEGNWVSEVHPSEGFETKTGTLLDSIPASTGLEGLEQLDSIAGSIGKSYIDRGLENPLQKALRERDAAALKAKPELNDDIPF